MKLLYIARHAKSSWNNPFCSDFDRGLNARGKRDLKTMKHLLKKHYSCPDCILASPAKRTKKTAKAYATQRGYTKKKIVSDEHMYLASATKWIKFIESIDEKNTSVMILGHNPGLTELVNICGYTLENLPTCGIVVFRYEGEFRGNFEPKKCVFDAIYLPKNNQL